jgi:hypothetical protein
MMATLSAVSPARVRAFTTAPPVSTRRTCSMSPDSTACSSRSLRSICVARICRNHGDASTATVSTMGNTNSPSTSSFDAY